MIEKLKVKCLLLFICLLTAGGWSIANAALPSSASTGYLYNAESGKFLSLGDLFKTGSDGGLYFSVVADDYGLPIAFVSTSDDNILNDGGTRYRFYLKTNDYVLRNYGEGANFAWYDMNKSRDNSVFSLSEVSNGKFVVRVQHNIGGTYQGTYLAIDYNNPSGKLTHTQATTAPNQIDLSTFNPYAIWEVKTPAQQKAIVQAAALARLQSVATNGGLGTVSSVASFESLVNSSSFTAINKTSSINNAALTSSTNGWTVTKSSASASVANGSYTIFNASPAQFTCTQTVSNLPEGLYKVTLQAFYRASTMERCVEYGGSGYFLSNAYLEANSNKVAIVDWYSIRTDNSNPNSRGKFKDTFGDSQYTNTVYTYVGSDGKLNLKIAVPSYSGLRGSANEADWFCFNNVTLTYYQGNSSSAIINAAKSQANAALSLLDQKQDAGVKAALQTAIENILNMDESSATSASVQTMVETLETAVANSNESIDFYANVNSVIANATAKATAMGVQPQFDASAYTAAYNAGSLSSSAILDIKNLLASAVKYQTAPLSNMTDAIIGASCGELNGLALPANINSVDALHAAPDGWTLTYTDGNAHSGIEFCINNWSTEGNTDGSDMRNPFIQYYNANGSDTTLPDATIAHDKITGLPAGEYTISILGRTAHKDTNTRCSGTVFYANGQEVRFSSGTAYNYNSGAKTGKYGIYTINLTLAEGQDLDFGVYTQNADYYFLSFKDVALTYWGNNRDDFEEIPQSNVDGGGAAKIVSSGYTQYTASDQTQVAIKVKNVDVSCADYIVIKFAEPVSSSVWKVAYSGVESPDAWCDVPQGATEYVISIDGTQYASTGVLPEVTLMTGWGAGEPIKVMGVYKHLLPGIPMEVSADAQWATFVAPMDIPVAQLPDGITAYTVTYDATNDKMVNTPVESTIEAGTPVLLRNATQNDIFKKFYYNGDIPTDLYENGLLIGSCTDIASVPQTTAEGYATYVLDTRNGDTGWYKVGTDNIALPAFSAYCYVDDANAADYYPAGEEFTLLFDMENATARAFLDNTTYTRNTSSVVASYQSQSTSYRKDQPNGITLKWKADNSSAQTITISEYEDFSYATTYNVGQSVGEYTIYNLIPDRVYYYKVSSNSNESIIKKGTFEGRGPLRMGYVDGMANVRDLGGWTTQDGYKVVYGKIYRGSGTQNITSSGIRTMKEDLGIKAELDIRRASESPQYSLLGDDVTYRFTEQTDGYRDKLISDKSLWHDNLIFVLNCLKANKPVYFHCVVGADRTGTMAFLIEGLLGMSMSDIYKDYELTTFSSLNTPRYKHSNTYDSSNLDDTFDYINSFSGETLQDRFYTYLTTELGLTADEIADFRDIMLGTYSPEELIADMLEEAGGLTDKYMNRDVKNELLDAMETLENIDDDATENVVQAAIRDLSTAIDAAKQSISDYEETIAAISTFTTKSGSLDASGQAAFDVSDIAAAYADCTLEGNGYNDVREAYMDAVKAQTTVGCDMTGAIINACCYEHDGVPVTSGSSSNKRLADDWPLSIDWNDYCINTWSTEGNSDGSNMTTPYLQYWTPNAALYDSTIDHSTIYGLPAGTYQISIFARTLQKQSQLADANDPDPYKAGGCVFYANDNTIALSTGTKCALSDMSKAGKYGTYTIEFTLEEDEPLNIGFRLEGVDFYFLTFRDCHLTYLGGAATATKVEIEQTVSDGGIAAKQEFADYTQYTASKATQVAVKVKNIDVTNCDCIVLKFAEPVNSTEWKVAYSGVQSDAAWNSIPNGSMSYKIQIKGTQYETAGILPEVTLMSGWGVPSVPVKLKGIYKYLNLDNPTEFQTSLSSVDDYSWSTLYLDYAVEIPEGVNAYYAVLNGNSVDLIEIENIIPAQTAVVLRSSSANTGMDAQFEVTDAVNANADVIAAENMLVGYSYDHPIKYTNCGNIYIYIYGEYSSASIPHHFGEGHSHFCT